MFGFGALTNYLDDWSDISFTIAQSWIPHAHLFITNYMDCITNLEDFFKSRCVNVGLST